MAMSEVKRYPFQVEGMKEKGMVAATDFDAERQARLEAERQLSNHQGIVDCAREARDIEARRADDAERQVGGLREQLAGCCERADTLQVAADASNTMLDTAMGLLVRVQQQAYLLDVSFGFPLHDDIEEFLNTTSTEGKDHG